MSWLQTGEYDLAALGWLVGLTHGEMGREPGRRPSGFWTSDMQREISREEYTRRQHELLKDWRS